VGVTVVEILDIFHAYAHLWEAGRAVFDMPDALVAWAAPLKDALYEHGAPAVLTAPDALVPPNPAVAEVVWRERAYVADNAAHMAYPRFVAAQLHSGRALKSRVRLARHRRRCRGVRHDWSDVDNPAPYLHSKGQGGQ